MALKRLLALPSLTSTVNSLSLREQNWECVWEAPRISFAGLPDAMS
jgi:hypothetical protein